jgi:hypothetical protein
MSKDDVMRKLNYAKETKEMFKDKLISRNSGVTDSTSFSEYPNKIKFLYQTPPKYGAVFQSIMPSVDADGTVYLGEVEPWVFDGVSEENNIITVEASAMKGICMGNKGIVEVKLDNLTTAGAGALSQAFENCTNLVKVNLDNLQSIVFNRAFANCTNLSDIGNFGQYLVGVAPGNSLQRTFMGTKIKSLNLSGITEGGPNGAFTSMCQNCTELESVDFSNLEKFSFESMNSTFNGCTKLTMVLMPKVNLSSNGTLNATFANCPSLESIDLSGVTMLGSKGDMNQSFMSAFANDTKLKNVVLSNLVPITVPTQAFCGTFKGCTALTYNPINISAIESIGDRAFESTFENSGLSGTISFDGLRIASSPNGQGKFGSCFANTPNLEEISFPVLEEGVNTGSASTPGRAYFSNMANTSGIRKISFPQLRTNDIGTCFYRMCLNCANLTEVDFSSLETTSSLGLDFQETFRECISLEEVRFPALKNIQGANTFQSAFHSCTNLKKVYFNSLETAHASAFNAMFNVHCISLTEVHFPASSQSLVESLTGYSSKFGAPSTCQILFDL